MLEVIEEASLEAEKPKEEPVDAADKEQDVESEDSDDVFYENKVHFADKYLEIWIRSWKKPRIRIRLPYIVGMMYRYTSIYGIQFSLPWYKIIRNKRYYMHHSKIIVSLDLTGYIRKMRIWVPLAQIALIKKMNITVFVVTLETNPD